MARLPALSIERLVLAMAVLPFSTVFAALPFVGGTWDKSITVGKAPGFSLAYDDRDQNVYPDHWRFCPPAGYLKLTKRINSTSGGTRFEAEAIFIKPAGPCATATPWTAVRKIAEVVRTTNLDASRLTFDFDTKNTAVRLNGSLLIKSSVCVYTHTIKPPVFSGGFLFSTSNIEFFRYSNKTCVTGARIVFDSAKTTCVPNRQRTLSTFEDYYVKRSERQSIVCTNGTAVTARLVIGGDTFTFAATTIYNDDSTLNFSNITTPGRRMLREAASMPAASELAAPAELVAGRRMLRAGAGARKLLWDVELNTAPENAYNTFTINEPQGTFSFQQIYENGPEWLIRASNNRTYGDETRWTVPISALKPLWTVPPPGTQQQFVLKFTVNSTACTYVKDPLYGQFQDKCGVPATVVVDIKTTCGPVAQLAQRYFRESFYVPGRCETSDKSSTCVRGAAPVSIAVKSGNTSYVVRGTPSWTQQTGSLLHNLPWPPGTSCYGVFGGY